MPCQINQIKQAHWRQALRNQEVLCLKQLGLPCCQLPTMSHFHALSGRSIIRSATTHPEFNFSNESCVCSDLWCMLSMSSRASPFYAMFQNHLFFSIAPQRRLQTFCRTTRRDAVFAPALCILVTGPVESMALMMPPRRSRPDEQRM